MHYSVISVATPAPTVRPPSRIANRSSFSIATGVIKSIVIVTLSPAIPIFLPPLHPPPPHPPLHHRPPPLDRKNVLDRHQKRLVDRPLRRRNVAVHRLHQLPDALARLRVPRLLHRPQRRPPDDRCRVPRKLVLLQQLPHLQLHQVQNLRVVHHVHLAHAHHQPRPLHFPRQHHLHPHL